MGGLAVATAAPRAAGFDVAFVDHDDQERRGALAQLWSVRFENMNPVRTFHSFQGQRNYQGAWWLSTTGAHVGFESWLERDHVMLLDFSPDVVGLSSQPFWLSWQAAGRIRRHAPDFFVRRADGSGVVIDVRPDERIGPEDAEVFAVTAQACESVGWEYRRVGAVDPLLLANVRWLAGYRHRRCVNAAHVSGLCEVFRDRVPMAEGVAAVGDRLAVLPTLFHLLWTRVLSAELRAEALHSSTVIETTRSRR